VLIAVLFATSLHFIMGPGGMHSFGHAAYFGLGAYGAALMVKFLAAPTPVALIVAPLAALFLTLDAPRVNRTDFIAPSYAARRASGLECRMPMARRSFSSPDRRDSIAWLTLRARRS